MATQHHSDSTGSIAKGAQAIGPITNLAELASALLKAAVDKAVGDNKPLGHEALAAVILPQVPEPDRENLEMGLFAAFRNGLFTEESPDKFKDLPQEGLSLAVAAGRELRLVMEKVEASRNPAAVDFRGQEIRAIAVWIKLVEDRVRARNRWVTYARLSDVLQRGPGMPDFSMSTPEPTVRRSTPSGNRSKFPERASERQRQTARVGDLTESELARRAAALKAHQAAGQA